MQVRLDFQDGIWSLIFQFIILWVSLLFFLFYGCLFFSSFLFFFSIPFFPLRDPHQPSFGNFMSIHGMLIRVTVAQ